MTPHSHRSGRIGRLASLGIFILSPSVWANPPEITQQPASTRVYVNAFHTLTVRAVSDTQDPRVRYQWERDGHVISAGSSNITVIGGPAFAGVYRARVRNVDGTTISAPATVSVVYPGSIVEWGPDGDAGPAATTNVVEAAVGPRHTLVRLDDGTVSGWGDNSHGQTSPPAGLRDVRQLAAGLYHSLALTDDGRLVGWGSNTCGQLDIPAGLKSVKAVAAGPLHTLALLTDGTVVAWGDGSKGQLKIPAGLKEVTAVAAGTSHNLALQRDGTVKAWGLDDDAQCQVPAREGPFCAVAAGRRHSLALRENGTVAAWGDNSQGQARPPAGLTGVVAIAAGDFHSLALQRNGTVVAWGRKATEEHPVPTAALGPVWAISAQGERSAALNYSPALEYPVNPAQEILLLFNATSADSVALKDYYLAHRPMVSDVPALGLHTTTHERIQAADYEAEIRRPVVDWLGRHPTHRATYLILLLDLPTRRANAQEGPQASVAEALRRGAGTLQKPLVHHIHMGSLADCMAYVDKLKTFGDRYSPGQLIIRPGRTGYPNRRFVVDGIGYTHGGYVGRAVTNALARAQIDPADILYAQNGGSHIRSGTDVAGCLFWGANGGMGPNYATDGSVRFSGASGWYLIQTVESFNGQKSPPGQCSFQRWFSRDAFGGTRYANTPVGAVAHADEPGLTGINDPEFWRLWASGHTFGRAAWQSARSDFALAIGDPFVAWR